MDILNICSLQVIGARGDIKISPRLLMTKSCAMTGTRVLKITQVRILIFWYQTDHFILFMLSR